MFVLLSALHLHIFVITVLFVVRQSKLCLIPNLPFDTQVSTSTTFLHENSVDTVAQITFAQQCCNVRVVITQLLKFHVFYVRSQITRTQIK